MKSSSPTAFPDSQPQQNTTIMTNIQQAIETSKSRLEDLQAQSDELWQKYKTQEAIATRLQIEWYPVNCRKNAEAERLAALQSILAEEEAAQPKVFEAA